MDRDAMPRDAEILTDVLRERGVTVDALAERAGYDDKSIYRYMSGERTLPSIVIRAAFELTCDGRLLRLITGAVPVCVHLVASSSSFGPAAAATQTAAAGHRVPPFPDTLVNAGNAIESAGKIIRYLRDILQDGRVDVKDLVSLEKFIHEATRAGENLALAVASANAEIGRIRAGDTRGAK